jgi:G3E family GTPase
MAERLPKGPLPPIPIGVITGFLGAGKTSLLNRLLRDPLLSDTVVIVNEFGEIGLDHLLMEQIDENMVLLAAGCLCCTVRGDLIATLEDLLRRRDNNRIVPFKRVLIETTGLADPAPVLNAVLNHPYLGMRYVMDGLVTLVDAVNGLATLETHPEAVKQTAVADRLVLTKTDLVTEAEIVALRLKLAALNPGAILLDAAKGEANAAALIGLGPYDPSAKIPDVLRWLGAEAVANAHHTHNHDEPHQHDNEDEAGHAPHAHNINRHDEKIRAFCLTADTPVSSAALDRFLDLLRAAHGSKLLRLKGLVALKDAPDQPVLIQAVQHVLHPPVRLAAWPSDDHRTRLVLIVKDLDEAFATSLWDAFIGTPRIDAPDASVLLDNPLAPPTMSRMI